MFEYQKNFQRSNLLLNSASAKDIESFVAAGLVQLSCVVSNGAIENCVRDTLSEFSYKRSHSSVARYVTANLKWFTNPTSSKIVELLERFSADWAKEVADHLDDQTTTAINSIIHNRHLIAHGRPVVLGASAMRTWNLKAEKFCDSFWIVINS